MALEKIDKFYQDFDTFFALVFHDLALSAVVDNIYVCSSFIPVRFIFGAGGSYVNV